MIIQQYFREKMSGCGGPIIKLRNHFHTSFFGKQGARAERKNDFISFVPVQVEDRDFGFNPACLLVARIQSFDRTVIAPFLNWARQLGVCGMRASAILRREQRPTTIRAGFCNDPTCCVSSVRSLSNDESFINVILFFLIF